MIENRQGGEGRAIGKMLLEDPLEKLPIQGEGGEIEPARQRLHKLVRSCGQLDRNIRPKIGEVLAEVKSIYDSLSGSGERLLTVWEPWWHQFIVGQHPWKSPERAKLPRGARYTTA